MDCGQVRGTLPMRLMKFYRDGYVLRTDGPLGAEYAKTVQFIGKRKRASDGRGTVTLVRSARTGRLLRVERSRKP